MTQPSRYRKTCYRSIEAKAPISNPRPSHHYRLQLSYNGSEFSGWQSQSHGSTVQDTIEATMQPLLGSLHRLVPASRTDTGVHALQQYASFRTFAPIASPLAFLQALQATLPNSIRLVHIDEVPRNFHPSKDATGKVYCYRLRRSSRETIPTPGYWPLYRNMSLDILRRELSALVGTHDFTSFCAADTEAVSKTRNMIDIVTEDTDDGILIWFAANGFLKQMIRIIVGSAVECATGKKNAASLSEILAKGSRLAAGRCAPADGLFLVQVAYGDPLKYPQPLHSIDDLFSMQDH